MTTTPTLWRRPPGPTVAHLGFGCGWLLLAPTFMKFGLPAVLIDHRLVQDTDLKLEPFASHDPSTPWYEVDACIRYSTGTLGLWQLRPEQLIATDVETRGKHELDRHNRIILIIGDSYEVQLSWSALWECQIGECDLETRV